MKIIWTILTCVNLLFCCKSLYHLFYFLFVKFKKKTMRYYPTFFRMLLPNFKRLIIIGKEKKRTLLHSVRKLIHTAMKSMKIA